MELQGTFGSKSQNYHHGTCWFGQSEPFIKEVSQGPWVRELVGQGQQGDSVRWPLHIPLSVPWALVSPLLDQPKNSEHLCLPGLFNSQSTFLPRPRD